MCECLLHISCGLCPTLIVQYGIGGGGEECCVQSLGTRGIVCCLVRCWLWVDQLEVCSMWPAIGCQRQVYVGVCGIFRPN